MKPGRECILCGEQNVVGFCKCSFWPDRKKIENIQKQNEVNKAKLEKAISELRYEEKTLRDEFAMAALSGFRIGVEKDFYLTYAEHIYQLADAMLEARKDKGE